MLEENSKKSVLLVGQTPPPFHGQSIVTAMLFDHQWKNLDVSLLRMAYSDSIDVVGKASFRKVLHLFSLIFKTWKIAFLKRPKILYYLPASSNKAAVIRDIIYLSAVRWCFSKKVFHYHAGGLPEYLESAGLLGKLGKWVYRRADASIEICQTPLPPSKAFEAKQQVFIPNGLDVELLERKSTEEFKRVLFVGALNEGKGVMECLKAVSALKEKSPDLAIKMSFAGAWASSEFQQECENYVSNNQLDCVEFLGILKGQDKWQAYADADIFFFPSHYQSENFPLVLIEALACGLPVITTHWRGIPQLMEGSEAGILCETKNQEEFVSALEKYCSDEELQSQHSENATRHYQANFTRMKFIQKMEAVFCKL